MQKEYYKILDLILEAQKDEMLEMVIRNQKKWNNRYQEDELIIKILKLIVCDSPLTLLTNLMAKTHSSSFHGWIFFLQTLRLILENGLLQDDVIGFLKSEILNC